MKIYLIFLFIVCLKTLDSAQQQKKEQEKKDISKNESADKISVEKNADNIVNVDLKKLQSTNKQERNLRQVQTEQSKTKLVKESNNQERDLRSSRGGHRGSRGRYPNNRGGHRGSRGRYPNNRGGHRGNRGRYPNNRGGHQSSRGRYPNNRRGHQSSRNNQYNRKRYQSQRYPTRQSQYQRQQQYRRRPQRPRIYLQKKPTQECMVTAEIFPLQYVQITRTAEVRIIFESNCIPKKEIVFQYNFEDDKDADFSQPPNKLNFKLFDNYYAIKFSEPQIWDEHDLMRTKYFSKAKFQNIQDEIEMDLNKKSTVFLTPQEYNTFSKYNLQKLQNLNQFFSCQIKKNMIPGWKMQASLDYLRYSQFVDLKNVPKKKVYAGVIDVEEAHDKFGEIQKKLLMRNRKFKNKESQMLLDNYDFKTFFKDGKIWIGKNPYINNIEMVCEIH